MKVSRSPSMALIAKFRYLMLVEHYSKPLFSVLSQGQQTTAEQSRMWATAHRTEMMMVFLDTSQHLHISWAEPILSNTSNTIHERQEKKSKVRDLSRKVRSSIYRWLFEGQMLRLCGIMFLRNFFWRVESSPELELFKPDVMIHVKLLTLLCDQKWSINQKKRRSWSSSTWIWSWNVTLLWLLIRFFCDLMRWKSKSMKGAKKVWIRFVPIVAVRCCCLSSY